MLFHRDLEADLCVHAAAAIICGCRPTLRFALLFDDGALRRDRRCPTRRDDPLHFRDRKRYAERLKEAQATSSGRDAALVGATARSAASPAVVAAFDFAFMGGSMGVAVGEAFVAAARPRGRSARRR